MTPRTAGIVRQPRSASLSARRSAACPLRPATTAVSWVHLWDWARIEASPPRRETSWWRERSIDANPRSLIDMTLKSPVGRSRRGMQADMCADHHLCETRVMWRQPVNGSEPCGGFSREEDIRPYGRLGQHSFVATLAERIVRGCAVSRERRQICHEHPAVHDTTQTTIAIVAAHRSAEAAHASARLHHVNLPPNTVLMASPLAFVGNSCDRSGRR
jgi:hypothetical protein